MSAPWSTKGNKTTPVDTDQLMIIDSEDAVPATQNKLTTLADVLAISQSSQVFLFKTQAELEVKFGTNIIIPDGEAWKLIYLENYTLSKPIQIGNGSSLHYTSAFSDLTTTYTGSGEMFQNENPANPIVNLRVTDCFLTSATSELMFDIAGATFFSFMNMGIAQFAGYGTVRTTFAVMDTVGGFFVNEGITFINLIELKSESFTINNSSNPGLTLIQIINSNNVVVTINGSSLRDTNGVTLYLDSNSFPASYTVSNTTGDYSDFITPGPTVAITTVLDAAGQARFNTGGPAHGYKIGQAIRMTGFAESSYNGTFIVNNIPTGAEFMLSGVAFVADDSGTSNPTSMNTKDTRFRAFNNKDAQDSMNTAKAGLELFGSEQTVTINTIDVPEVVDNVNWVFSNLERFNTPVTDEGQVSSTDPVTRRYSVQFSGTVEKVGGGSVDIGIVLLRFGSLISFNSPHTVNTGKIQISGSDIIELSTGATLQIGVINYLDTANIDVSQLNMTVNLA